MIDFEIDGLAGKNFWDKIEDYELVFLKIA